MKDSTLLECDGLPGPVLFRHCPELLDLLHHCYLDWPYTTSHSNAPALITVSGTGHGYAMRSQRHPSPIRQTAPLDMACAFIAELYWPLLEANRHLLCLHGAAAEFSGKLVVFPNRYRAGKSVLSACLVASGTRLFSDDVLPLEEDSGLGIAMGIRPRLRIPLPSDLSPRTRNFLKSRWGPSSNRYGYLELSRSEMATAGEKRPVGALVFLERGEQKQPTLSEISRAEVLRQVIWQNFARDLHSATIVERLRHIVERSPCFKIRYQRAEDAVALLAKTFSDWSNHRVNAALTPDTREPQAFPVTATLGPRRYLQRPGIFETTLEGERFLASENGSAIYHLNPVASGIWQALAEPMTTESLVDLASAAFPSTDVDIIERDIKSLIADLLARELIRASGQSG